MKQTEKCETEPKARIFYGIKNQEQGVEKRKYSVGWGHKVSFIWGEKEQRP